MQDLVDIGGYYRRWYVLRPVWGVCIAVVACTAVVDRVAGTAVAGTVAAGIAAVGTVAVGFAVAVGSVP